MTNPYKLPDGPVDIQFSGGRTSGYMLRAILDRYDGVLPDDCHVVFQNTGREMPETLDFVHQCQVRWNVPIVWLEYHPVGGFIEVSHNSASRDGEPFERMIDKKKYLPNQTARFCTSDLKVRPVRDWMRFKGYDRWTALLGLRADEPNRVANMRKPLKEKWSVEMPLADAGVGKRDVEFFWRQQDFDLKLQNIGGKTPLGNCDGCFLKSEANRAFLARYYPERAKWWDDMEKKVGNTFQRSDNKYASDWATLIKNAGLQPDWVFDEENDVYCTSSLGGCHD